ncbi:MAG: thiamine pyrophosphate-dependent enzyme [Alistipes indistinctus]
MQSRRIISLGGSTVTSSRVPSLWSIGKSLRTAESKVHEKTTGGILSYPKGIRSPKRSTRHWPGRKGASWCYAAACRHLFVRPVFSIIVRHHLPIKIVVLNSLSGGLWRLLAEMAGREKWEADLYDTDFGAFAQVMGMAGFSLSDPAKADEMLRRMFEMEGPALLDVKTVSAGSGARTDRKEANVSRFTPVALPARKVWRNRHFDGKRIGR